MSYAVRRPRPAVLWTVLSFAAFFAFAVLIVKVDAWFLVIGGLIAAWNLWSTSLVVSVGARGVRFGGRSAPTRRCPTRWGR